MKGEQDMKRYDKLRFTEHRSTGSKSCDLTEAEFKTVINEYHDIFKVYVQCRKCSHLHEVAVKCPCCYIETKIK
jgi:hypothetical protein